MKKKRAIIPKAARDAMSASRMSPGTLAEGFLFLTGMTGSRPDGEMPMDPEEQFRGAFDKIGEVLAEAGPGFDAVVEMTNYNAGLRWHLPCLITRGWTSWRRPTPRGLRSRWRGFGASGRLSRSG
ncbi:Rid family hydrolase [Paracoccus tegillarcae]|uniref:Rid family hydrolase n=1 Tax=Paracoccus tegillarcae TaxID=1529068 RepID=UPI001E63C44A|nr:Rid family hydrolase [Paracoccus tegillarcae]